MRWRRSCSEPRARHHRLGPLTRRRLVRKLGSIETGAAMRKSILFSLLCVAFALPVSGHAESYRIDWYIALEAGEDYAKVTLMIEDGRPVRRVRFRYDPERFADFDAEGELEVTRDSVLWEPARENASLSYQAKITRARDNMNQAESYDALMTDDWALFRGDRVIPSMNVTTRAGAVSEAVLHFDLPEGWDVNTGWPLHQEEGAVHAYRVDDPDRRFDRPTGWIMAGKLGSRRDRVGDTYFSVVAPMNSQADRMGWLTLVSLVYPEIEKAFEKLPGKILMVSADDPLWRGGLSGPNSFYFHSSRRAISENGTSPLLHELTHVITRIRGADNDDWIAEGLAEYYSVELLYRAGGFSADRKEAILRRLAEWGQEAPGLRQPQSTGPVTARAVVLFHELDEEIAELTHGRANLDAVTRLLMEKRRVGLGDLAAAFEAVTGSPSRLLSTVDAAP
jgi:hypothetical protein